MTELQLILIDLFYFSVSDIQCTFMNEARRADKGIVGTRDSITAKLRKPEGFKGSPLFADDRGVDPLNDPICQIRPDPTDLTHHTYLLVVSDFTRCGVLKRNVSTYARKGLYAFFIVYIFIYF